MGFLSIFNKSQTQDSSASHPGHFDYGQLSVILSGIKDGVIIIDGNNTIMVVNKAAQALLGLAEEPKGIVFEKIAKVFKNGSDITSTIWSGNFSDDNIKLSVASSPPKEVSVSLSVIQVVAGQVPVWVITMRDVSVERQLEEMKMGFVSIAAHELRTPLTSIKGYLSVFMGDYKDKLNEDQVNLLNHISSSTERLLVLVENLLNVSRVERGAMEFNPTGEVWTEIVQQIVDDLRTRATEKNIQLTFIAPSLRLPKARVDKVRIGEVLSNLISNAIVYTEPNGKIDVTVELQGGEIITHISDTGRGIPQEAMSHLFTKFYRVNTGLAQGGNSEGNGLGLYISKAIVDMHHGKIWVTSEVGKGSVFSFSVPVV